MNQGSPSDARSTGKDPIEDDSSDSGPENEPANSKHLSLPNVAQPKNMPKCPTPDRMFNWRIGDYERYDDYLITKWNLFGFSDNETTYMVSLCLFIESLFTYIVFNYQYQFRLEFSTFIDVLSYIYAEH